MDVEVRTRGRPSAKTREAFLSGGFEGLPTKGRASTACIGSKPFEAGLKNPYASARAVGVIAGVAGSIARRLFLEGQVEGRRRLATAQSKRATRPDTRNPVLRLPAFEMLQALDRQSQAALRAVLSDLRRDARERAEKAWSSGKGYVAAYWRAVATYAGHTARALRGGAGVVRNDPPGSRAWPKRTP